MKKRKNIAKTLRHGVALYARAATMSELMGRGNRH